LPLFSLVAVAVLALPPGKHFERIIIIQFENHAEDEVIRDPNFAKYTKMGRGCLNYFAVTHPSQPNYWAQVAGDYFLIHSDSNFDLDRSNLADLMDAKGVTWKTYQEDYPGNCRPDEVIGRYARKHNPFISFNNIRNNKTRCANIVNSGDFDSDLKAGKLPQYSYYTPNLDNDAHDTNITFAGKWLDGFLAPRLGNIPPGTLMVVTWDEDDFTEGNKILSFFLDFPTGSMFASGSSDKTKYNHYSLLASVEDNWSLGNLGRNDKGATVFNFKADYNLTETA